MANQVTLVVGDTTPDLVAFLQNARGPQDLTGARVTMVLRGWGGTLSSLPCTLDVPPTRGVARHVWRPSETAQAGTSGLVFVVRYFNGQQQTFPSTGQLSVVIRYPFG